MKVSAVLKPLAITSIMLFGATSSYASTALDNGFIAIDGGVSKTLSFALKHLYDTKAPENISTVPDAIIVNNRNQEPAIICSLTKANCMFSTDLHAFSHEAKITDQTVFDALHAVAIQNRSNKNFEKIQNLMIGGNTNRTSLTLEENFKVNFRVHQKIECGAYPSRNIEGAFESARCDFDVGVAERGPEAESLYQAIKSKSDLSARLAALESDPTLELASVKLLKKVSWARYQWSELRLIYKTKLPTGSMPESGSLSSINLNIFVNGIAENGDVRIEKSNEYFDRFITIGPR